MDLSVECCDSRNQKSPNGTPQDDVLAAEPCGRTPDDFTSLNCGTRFEDIREIFAHSQTATANSPGTNDSELALPDRYTGIEWLARGGMGSVYRAVDRPLSRFVAIKVATDRRRLRTGRQRFIAEARTLAQLQHPGIPAVYELGRQEDERPYIAMKLVNGRTLTELLQARSSPDDRLAYFLGIFRHVCDTMAYVHSQGVVHRDLKPENIMVGEFGEVQVMDWGLAKRLHGSTEETAASTDEGVDVESFRSDAPTPPEPELDAPWSATEVCTEVGSVMGTAPYMAPEQARGDLRALDERADVFALGAMLHEIVLGVPPTNARSSHQFRQLLEDGALSHARLRLAGATIDPWLKRLTIGCLEENPERRIRSAAILAEEMRANLEGAQDRLHALEVERITRDAAAAVQHQRRRLQLATAAMTCVIGIVGVAVWGFLQLHAADQHYEIISDYSTAMTQGKELRNRALAMPLGGGAVWESAVQSVARAEQNALQLSGLERKAAAALAATIRAESDAAARDRELITALVAAQVSVRPTEMDLSDGAREIDFLQDSLRGLRRDLLPRRRPGPMRGELIPPPERLLAVHRARGAVLADRYLLAFRNYGFDPELIEPSAAGAVIRGRSRQVRSEILTGLDVWLGGSLLSEREQNDISWIAAVLQNIDPDEFRTRVRKDLIDGAVIDLRPKLADKEFIDHPPGLIWAAATSAAETDDGIDLLRRALSRHPGSPLLNHELAQYYFTLGELDSAAGYMTAAAAVHSDGFSLVRIGETFLRQRRYEEALAYFEGALRVAPNQLEPYRNCSELLIALDRHDEALEVLESGIARVSPDTPGLWMLLMQAGQLYERSGRLNHALEAYDRALGIDGLPPPECMLLTFQTLELEDRLKGEGAKAAEGVVVP